MKTSDATAVKATKTVSAKSETTSGKPGRAKTPLNVKIAEAQENVKRGWLPRIQIRILVALSELPRDGWLSSRQIAEEADVPPTHVAGVTYKNSKRWLSLVELGFAEEDTLDLDDAEEHVARITPAGRKFLRRYMTQQAKKAAESAAK